MKTFITAEIGINHNGDMDICKTHRYSQRIVDVMLNFRKET